MWLLIDKFYTQKFSKNNMTQLSIFSLYPFLQKSCCPLCRRFRWLLGHLPAAPSSPCYQLSRLTTKITQNNPSSLEFNSNARYMQTLTCFILSFWDCFSYDYCLYNQIIIQFLLSLKMFGVMGIWSRTWSSDLKLSKYEFELIYVSYCDLCCKSRKIWY